MAKLIGMGGSVTANSVTCPVSTWSANITNDVQDVTDTGSNGWTARLAAVNSVELTGTAFWGGAASSLAGAFGIGTAITISAAIGNSGAVVSGTFVVSNYTITNPAKAPVEFQFTAQSTGVIALPT